MIACCKGGTAVNLFGSATRQHDPEQVGDVTCGQAKEDTQDAQFLDPRNLPILHSLFTVQSNGKIQVNVDACLRTCVPQERVERTIEILQLDADRLKRARARRWAAINEKYANDFANTEVMRRAAQAELLPDANRNLPPFFTTNRSYFRHHSNDVIADSDYGWV